MDNQELHCRMRRKTLLRLAASATFATTGLFSWTRGAWAAGSLPATPGMHHVRGPVAIDQRRATIGAVIQPGQTVATGVGGEALYILGSDAFFQRENTKATFDDSSGTPTLRMTGKMLCTFGKTARRLVTPTATIAIRGGACYVEADETKTYFCLCYGEADIVPTADPSKKETLKTRHHDRPVFIHAKGASPLISPATVVAHGDEELTLLDNSMGRWPAFHPRGGGGK